LAKGKVIQRIIELKDKFTPGLNKVQKGTLQFKKDVKDLKKVGSAAFKGVAVGIAATGAAAIAAGVGFTALVNKTAQAGDRIDKMSQKLGLSRQGFQELDYVLGQNGMSIDQLQMGMKTFATQMDQSNQGVKSSTELFNRLGLDSSTALKSQEEAFKDVVGAFQQMEQGAEKTALANKLFGRSGQEMLPMLNQQEGSIEELLKTYDKLGSAMSDNAIDNSVKFGDTLDDLKLGIAGMFRSLSSPALPHFTKGMQWLIDKIPIIKKFGVDAFTSMKSAIEDNQEKIDAIKSVFFDVKNGIVDAFGSNGEGGGALDWFINTGIPSVVGGIATVLDGATKTYSFFRDNWSLISPIIYGIVSALVAYKTIQMGIATWTSIVTLKQWAWNAAMTANPIGLVVLAIGGLIAAGVFLIKNFENIELAGDKAWNGIVGGVEWGVNMVIAGVNLLVKGAIDELNSLIKIINKIPGVDIGEVSYSGFKDVDFGVAKIDTEGREFNWRNNSKEDTAFKDMLSDYDEQQHMLGMQQQTSNNSLIQALDENTDTMKGTAGRVNDIHVTLYAADMTPEEIAQKVVPAIKKLLFAT
jgi:hypothetical protein